MLTREYIQIDDTVYSVLNNVEYKGLEISVVLEVREDEPAMGEEAI